MLENFEQLRSSCITFVFSEDQMYGARLGGNPPVGISPVLVEKSTRYFCTMPIGDKEVSLFISVDPKSEDGGFWENSSKILSTDCPIVQFVLHKPLPRDYEASHFLSELDSCGFSFNKCSIPDAAAFESIVTSHKIGGYPFFHNWDTKLIKECELLLNDGWHHYFQITFPTDLDKGINTTWPFAGDVFHVFVRENKSHIEFKYVWG